MKAAEVHQLGLRQVERLRREIGEVALQTGFKGTTDAFIESLRTDKKYFFDSSDSLLAAYREVASESIRSCPNCSMRLPHALCGAGHDAVRVGQQHGRQLHARIASARHQRLLRRSTRSALQERATWRTETLFVHEAVPGHHMQSRERRRWRSSTLGARWEAGTWRTPKAGRSTRRSSASISASTRTPSSTTGTCRPSSFVPRGSSSIRHHAYNWPRDKAIAYMTGQGGLDQDFAASEVDRYFSNPSQALGYMLGQRKFLELRARAERTLVRNSMCAISTPP